MSNIKNIQIDGIRIFIGQGTIELVDGGGSTVELEARDIEAAIAALQTARAILQQQQGEAEPGGLAA